MESLVEAAAELGNTAGQPDALLIYAGQLGVLREYQGRSDEVIDLVAQSADDFPLIPGFRAALAVILANVGRLDEGREIVEDAAADGFANVPRDEVTSPTPSFDV